MLTPIALLIQKASEARQNAYAPYSNYKVGTSLLFEDNTIITGSNQENASYPLCICAETSALSHAGSYYPNKIIKSMAISGQHSDHSGQPVTGSCGAYRQVILEFELRPNVPIKIYLYQAGLVIVEIPSIKSILPFYFDNSYLQV